MMFATNSPSNSEDKAQEEEEEDDEEDVRKEEDQMKRAWLERSAPRVEYHPTPQQQKSNPGLLVTGLSNLKPVLLWSTSTIDADSAKQTIQRILEILGMGQKTNIMDQQYQQQKQYQKQKQKQQRQQLRDAAGLREPVPSSNPPEKSALWKVPPSSINAYISQLMAKPKLRDDLLRKMTSMGLKGLSRTVVDEALRQILNESSKADRELRQRSGSNGTNYQSSFNRPGYGYQSRGHRGETVGADGKGLGLLVVGDQVYSGHSKLDSKALTVRPDRAQNLASSRPGRASPRSRLHGSRRTSAQRTSGIRPRHGKTSRKSSSERKRGSSVAEETSKGIDPKKRKLSAASAKNVGQPETVHRRRSSGTGREATPGDQNLLLQADDGPMHEKTRLSKGTMGKIDEGKMGKVDKDKAGTTQRLSKEMRIDAPSDLTKGVASDLPEKRPTSSPPKDPTAGDLLGPAARSHTTPKQGFVSAASPSPDRWADVAGKDAGAGTVATPQVTDLGTGLTMGMGKDVLERRPASSPVKKVGRGSIGDQLRPSTRSQTSTLQEFLQHDGFHTVNPGHPVRGSVSKKEDTRKVLVRGRTGRRRGVSMQSSSTNPPWPSPTKEEETKGGRISGLLASSPGSASEGDPGSAAAHQGPGSASDEVSQGSRRPMKERKDFGDKYFTASVSSSTGGAAHRESIKPRQDGGDLANDESPAMVAVEVGPTETGPTGTQIDSRPSEAQIKKTWSTLATDKRSPVVAPPPRRTFLARGDHYGLPAKGFELTRAFVFSYFRRMPPHYIDFKNNPPILIAPKMTKTKKKKKKKKY